MYTNNMSTVFHIGQLLFIPIMVTVVTQGVKIGVDKFRQPGKNIRLKNFTSYGGMPSSHSALFISLALMAYLQYGWNSFEFVVSLILYLTVVRDAVGIRWHLGVHGKILKQLIKELYREHNATIQHEKIITCLGHTPAQAVAGTLFGAVLTFTLYWLAN